MLQDTSSLLEWDGFARFFSFGSDSAAKKVQAHLSVGFVVWI